MKSSRLKKSLTPSQQHLDRSSSTWSNSLDGQLKMPLKSLLSILKTLKTPSTTSMRNTQGNHSHRTTLTSGLRLTGVCYVKKGGNVTVLAQLHIWHKSHTLPGSSICTVACLLCYCLVVYLAQVTHLAGKFHLHCYLFAPLLPDPLPIRTSSASPASSLLFSFSSFLVFCLVHQSKSQVSSQVRSRLLNQLDLSSALPLSCHSVFSLKSYLLQLSGSSYIQKPERGVLSEEYQLFCVVELAELVASLPPLPPGQVNIVLCTSVHSLR